MILKTYNNKSMTVSTLRIATLNVHKGLSSFRRKLVIAKLRESIRELRPNILFLQEVIGENRQHADRFDDWPPLPQYAYLAEEVWEDFVYGKNAEYLSGHHGNAILSEFPIETSQTIKISASSMEQRGFLYARICLKWKKTSLPLRPPWTFAALAYTANGRH
jgi:endonuclease/exonuclease/phosphatase family metal-dependent hydrolase